MLRGVTISRIAVFVVFIAAGVLFATSAVTSKTTRMRSETVTLVDLVHETSQHVDREAQRVSALQQRLDDLTKTATGTDDQALQKLREQAHLTPISGAGLTITLTDAPADLRTPEGVDPNQLVVHQQDVEAVVNAMWAGGARAIEVMDQRIISTSSVQCVGNTLRLQGRVYAPPYRITAIGDHKALTQALAGSAHLKEYRRFAQTVRLGYKEERFGNKQLPGFVGSVGVKYAVPHREKE